MASSRFRGATRRFRSVGRGYEDGALFGRLTQPGLGVLHDLLLFQRPFTRAAGLSPVSVHGGWTLVGLAALALPVLVWFRYLVLPARPADVPTPQPRRRPGEPRPSSDGAGVRIVVNPSAGSWGPQATEDLRGMLPAADIVELTEGDDLEALLGDSAFQIIGAAGGDGTLGAAAHIAARREVPLVPIPGGTLNHLARDLGLATPEDAVAGVREGGVACIDLGVVGDRTFVNTLSFGGYSAVVDARERLEGRLGKWPALVVALVHELHRMEPCRLEIDGHRVDIWLGWIGNGAYRPPGLAPAWRESLDDGLLDLRLVHGGRLARSRFVLAAMLGRLSVSGVYSERLVRSVSLRSLDGPLRLVGDGESFDGSDELIVDKRRRALQVVLPSSSVG